MYVIRLATRSDKIHLQTEGFHSNFIVLCLCFICRGVHLHHDRTRPNPVRSVDQNLYFFGIFHVWTKFWSDSIQISIRTGFCTPLFVFSQSRRCKNATTHIIFVFVGNCNIYNTVDPSIHLFRLLMFLLWFWIFGRVVIFIFTSSWTMRYAWSPQNIKH